MRKLIVGITGGYGTGKSTVASMFGKLGARVVDTDKLAHQAMAYGKRGYKKVVSVFGKDIVKGKEIQRQKLAEVVFGNKKKLKVLNSIIHPIVIKKIKDISRMSQKRIIIIDAPLLIEAGLRDFVDKIIVVRTQSATQMKRCIKRGNSKADIRLRKNCQLALAQKVHLADFIIDNNVGLDSTWRRVRRIWKELKNEVK